MLQTKSFVAIIANFIPKQYHAPLCGLGLRNWFQAYRHSWQLPHCFKVNLWLSYVAQLIEKLFHRGNHQFALSKKVQGLNMAQLLPFTHTWNVISKCCRIIVMELTESNALYKYCGDQTTQSPMKWLTVVKGCILKRVEKLQLVFLRVVMEICMLPPNVHLANVLAIQGLI